MNCQIFLYHVDENDSFDYVKEMEANQVIPIILKGKRNYIKKESNEKRKYLIVNEEKEIMGDCNLIHIAKFTKEGTSEISKVIWNIDQKFIPRKYQGRDFFTLIDFLECMLI